VSRQLVKQRLGVLQDGRVEAFGEPAINWCEEIASFGGFPLVAPEAGELKNCNLLRRGHQGPIFACLSFLTTTTESLHR
jgi:hypothetical protein